MGLEMISPVLLDGYVGRTDVVIIDVRSREAFEKAHIRGARNIPFGEHEGYRYFPKSRELILYCDRGSASLSQGRELAGKGYRVKSVIGGLDSYRGCNLVKNL